MKILPYNISTRGNEGCPGGSKTSGENEVKVTIRYLRYNQAEKKKNVFFNVLKCKKKKYEGNLHAFLMFNVP